MRSTKLALCLGAWWLVFGQAGAEDLGMRPVTMWTPCVEWSIDNPSFDGNPFDVVASATFTHTPSESRHTTEFYFAGGTEWRFRFTGTRLGAWTFITSSQDPDLNGHTGEVAVTRNPDDRVRGFLTHMGNQYAIQGADAEDLRGHLFQVYMNQHIVHTNFEAIRDPALLEAYLNDAQANGFDTVFTSLNNNWLKLGTLRYDEHDSVNPDLATFDLIEAILAEAHHRAMRWHFWAWGDESRKWTPIGLPGGIHGAVDRRLLRYIAARLGPLPGWSMGYGFDLIEWTTPEGRNGWAEYLHGKMGWDHLLGTRGFPLDGARNNLDAYSGFGDSELTTTRHGPADFAEVCKDFDADPRHPAFYEERHAYLREGFQLDMEGTRRLRWWQVMAGGVGGFFGFYAKSEYPYPNPEQLRTWQSFWKDRYMLGMHRAGDPKEAAILISGDARTAVIYQEDTETIHADLAGFQVKGHAVAVDTKREYAEVDLGTLDPGHPTIQLPHVSDWAVAVGDFKADSVSK